MTHRITKLPETVRVGAQHYRLEIVPQDTMNDIGIWGDCNYPLRRIRIQDEMPEASHAVETVIHELLHACYRAYHVEAERDEEYTVTRLAAALSAMLIDNPELREWINQTIP